MSRSPRPDSFYDRPIYRWSDRVYRLLALTIGILAATWPLLLALLVLRPEVGNAALFAVAAVPAGPGLAAGLYAARKLIDGDDAATGAMFWKGLRQSWADALKVWVVVLAVAAVLAIDLAWLRQQQSSWAAMLSAMLPVLAVLSAPCVVNALVLVGWFSFRFRDVWRLAAYYTFTKPLATVGLLLVFGALAAVVVAVSDWAAFWLLGLAAYAAAQLTAPAVEHATANFTLANGAADRSGGTHDGGDASTNDQEDQ